MSSIPAARGIAANASLQCPAMESVHVSSEARLATFVLRMTSLRLCAQEANHGVCKLFLAPKATPPHPHGELATKRLLLREVVQASDLDVAGQDRLIVPSGGLLGGSRWSAAEHKRELASATNPQHERRQLNRRKVR